MRSSANKTIKHFLVISGIAALILFMTGKPFAQVFPEVNSPAVQLQKQKEENEKLAMQYYNNKEFDKALELFRDLYKKQPSPFNYTYYLYCLLSLHEFSEAESLVKSKIRNEQGSYRYQVDLGYIYLQEDKNEKAAKYFDEIIEGLKPNKAMIMEVASAFQQRFLYDYAIKTYLKGRELLYYTEPFNSELARAYELSGNYGGMIDEYLDLLQRDPQQTDLVESRLQNLLSRDQDGQISDMLRQALLLRSQKNPENRNYAEMLLWLSIQRRDFDFALTQAKSLDTRYDGGGQLVFDLGNLCLANKDYKTATEAFAYILKYGEMNPYYTLSLTGMLRAKFLTITNGYDYSAKDLEVLDKEYGTALDQLGRNSRSVLLMRDQAHLKAFYLDQMEEAMTILETAVAIPGVPEITKAELKLELGDIYLFEGEVWDASLLYSQVEKAFKSEPIGHEAKLRNAKLSYYIGEFAWAKAQLDVLKAATSKLIANDAMELSLLISDNMDVDSTYTGLSYYARAELDIYRRQDDKALATLDSIGKLSLTHPLDDEVLYKKAEIYTRKKEYPIADSLLARIVKDYHYDILADNALFQRAELQQEVFKDNAKAMELYQQLMIEFPGSLFVTEARKRYRQLRGDAIN